MKKIILSGLFFSAAIVPLIMNIAGLNMASLVGSELGAQLIIFGALGVFGGMALYTMFYNDTPSTPPSVEHGPNVRLSAPPQANTIVNSVSGHSPSDYNPPVASADSAPEGKGHRVGVGNSAIKL